MTMLWISLAVVVALLLVWRLHRASKQLTRILDEELPPESPPTPDRDEHRAQHHNP